MSASGIKRTFTAAQCDVRFVPKATEVQRNKPRTIRGLSTGSASAAPISLLSRLIISLGVPFGAPRLVARSQAIVSPTVGTSGSAIVQERGADAHLSDL
jgi:hypothetical protein